MDMQPTLIGPALLMRAATPDDWDGLYAIGSDPSIWALHPAPGRWREPAFRAYVDEGLASGGMLVAVEQASGAICGTSRYSTQFAEPDEVEIGWTFLARTHWGGAVNREMKHLMLTHAFGGFPRVIFRIGEDNVRSRRAVEKIGARLLDRRETVDVSGTTVPYVVYAIERVEFRGLLDEA